MKPLTYPLKIKLKWQASTSSTIPIMYLNSNLEGLKTNTTVVTAQIVRHLASPDNKA